LYVGYDWARGTFVGEHYFSGDIQVDRRKGEISEVYCSGAIYGTLKGYEIDRVGSINDYFRELPTTESDLGEKDSYLNHLDSVKPLDLKKIFDCDGDPVSA